MGRRPNIDRYFGAKDKAGFLRYFESNYKEAVPRALRMSIAELDLGGKPGPKSNSAADPLSSGSSRLKGG